MGLSQKGRREGVFATNASDALTHNLFSIRLDALSSTSFCVTRSSGTVSAALPFCPTSSALRTLTDLCSNSSLPTTAPPHPDERPHATTRRRRLTKDEVVGRYLAVADLLRQRGVAHVRVSVEPGVPKLLRDLLRVLLVRRRNRNDEDLSWRQPERPGGTCQDRIWRRVLAAYHLPPKCSVRIAVKRSTLPMMARCIMTGRARSCSPPVAWSVWYWSLKRSGSWKSSWIVAHWCLLRKASEMVMSIWQLAGVSAGPDRELQRCSPSDRRTPHRPGRCPICRRRRTCRVHQTISACR